MNTQGLVNQICKEINSVRFSDLMFCILKYYDDWIRILLFQEMVFSRKWWFKKKNEKNNLSVNWMITKKGS